MWNGNKPDRVVYVEDYFNTKCRHRKMVWR